MARNLGLTAQNGDSTAFFETANPSYQWSFFAAVPNTCRNFDDLTNLAISDCVQWLLWILWGFLHLCWSPKTKKPAKCSEDSTTDQITVEEIGNGDFSRRGLVTWPGFRGSYFGWPFQIFAIWSPGFGPLLIEHNLVPQGLLLDDEVGSSITTAQCFSACIMNVDLFTVRIGLSIGKT